MHHFVGVPHHGGNIRRHKMAFIAHADNQGTPPSGHNDLIGNITMDNPESESPLYLTHGLSNRVRQIAVKIKGNQLRQNFRIRFRPERNALFLQLFFQKVVIFNNAVVNDKNVVRFVPLRMGVLYRGFTVRCPTGVGNADAALHGLAIHKGFQARDLSQFPETGNFVAVLNCKACRVVSPVFKSFQPFNQDWFCIFLSHITNNPAHVKILLRYPISEKSRWVSSQNIRPQCIANVKKTKYFNFFIMKIQ